MSIQQLKADIIIVGAGLAGITAALELLPSNKKVLLIDRDTKENIGGLAKWAFGGMFFVDTPLQRRAKFQDSTTLAWNDWQSTAQYGENDTWQKAWGEKYVNECTEKGFIWLKKQGVSFFPVVHWVERGWHKQGNSCPRFHMVWGTGYGLVKTLANNMLKHPKAAQNLEIKYQYKVEEILTKNNAVIGVKGKDEANGKQEWEAYADHIIIATGGLGGSLEKVRQYWVKDFGTAPETILNGSQPSADGLMHDAVSQVNGSLGHMRDHWHYAAGVHHPKPKHPNHGLSLVPPKSALWFNYKGERIGPEPLITAYDTRYLVEQICKQEKKMSWQILNLKIAYKEFAISGSEHNVAIRDKKPV
ncbi:MAG: FAD-dependent oxidoreductase [Chitinophagales bacterium]|nr:FAD-dependent oxidoreductase [Chitinophagales bacterium]